MMKILYYSPHPHLNLSDSSGYATHMREMIKAFKDEGHQVELLIMGGQVANDVSIYRSSRIKLIAKRLMPKILWETIKDWSLIKYDKKAASTLQKKVDSFMPDIIYERFNYIQTSGAVVAKRYHIKHIVEVNSPYIYERKKYQGNSLLLSKAKNNEQFVFVNCHRLVVVSSTLKEMFATKYNLENNKIIVTPNAVDLSSIKVNSTLKKNILSKLGENNTIIGFVGSIADWHGIDMLIEAFGELADKHKNIMLLIVGGGEKLVKYQEDVFKKGLGERVVFTDKVSHDKVYTYIDCMDITVLPTTNNYMSPIKIFEYGALSKVIVAPNVQSVRDVMVNEKDGILIEKDTNSLKNAISYLIENKLISNNLATSFNKKVIENHTWKSVAKKILVT